EIRLTLVKCREEADTSHTIGNTWTDNSAPCVNVNAVLTELHHTSYVTRSQAWHVVFSCGDLHKGIQAP
ncbi:mCG1048827, partial [Mus musculus]